MRVIVFGATGKTGQLVLRSAIAAGHQVTAFGRSVDRLDIDDPALTVFKGDALDDDAVASSVAGHDAAIVCLGSTGLRDKTTLSAGTQTVVDSLVMHGIDRLVVMSAAGVGDSWKQIPWSSRLLFRSLLRNLFADHHAQEAIVERSPLNWTVIRPGVLKDNPGTGNYSATNTGRITRIRRADVADCLVAQLSDTAHVRTAISVTN